MELTDYLRAAELAKDSGQSAPPFDFGVALQACKAGYKVSRYGWNFSAWLFYQKGYPDGIPINPNTAEATGIPLGTVCKFKPYLQLYNATEQAFYMWTPRTVDILAEDWYIV